MARIAELMPLGGDPSQNSRSRIQMMLDNPGTESVEQIAQELKRNMTDNCGIFRDDDRLKLAGKKISELKDRFKDARVMDKSARFNTDLLATIETDHLLSFSELIVGGALARTESRGAHSRTDYTGRDDENWLKHTMVRREEGDRPVFSYKPVNIDWDRYPPQERKY
jgi:succinate dehydrogenase / fumarate reductase flavoprotein subunit